jgi:hypothetical protein
MLKQLFYNAAVGGTTWLIAPLFGNPQDWRIFLFGILIAYAWDGIKYGYKNY